MLSEDVHELEMRDKSLLKIINLIPKDFCFGEEIFLKNIEHFQNICRNKALGYCLFPECCNYFKTCEDKKCNADECSNGYPNRRS